MPWNQLECKRTEARQACNVRNSLHLLAKRKKKFFSSAKYSSHAKLLEEAKLRSPQDVMHNVPETNPGGWYGTGVGKKG